MVRRSCKRPGTSVGPRRRSSSVSTTPSRSPMRAGRARVARQELVDAAMDRRWAKLYGANDEALASRPAGLDQLLLGLRGPASEIGLPQGLEIERLFRALHRDGELLATAETGEAKGDGRLLAANEALWEGTPPRRYRAGATAPGSAQRAGEDRWVHACRMRIAPASCPRSGPASGPGASTGVLKMCPRCERTMPMRAGVCDSCRKADNIRRTKKARASRRDSYHWRRLREQAKRATGCCQACGATSDLSVHVIGVGNHRSATLADCVTLCRSCHGRADAPRASGKPGGVVAPPLRRRERFSKSRLT